MWCVICSSPMWCQTPKFLLTEWLNITGTVLELLLELWGTVRNWVTDLYGFHISFNTCGNTHELWNRGRSTRETPESEERQCNFCFPFLDKVQQKLIGIKEKKQRRRRNKKVRATVPVLIDFDSGIFILFSSLFLTVSASVLSFSNHSTDDKKFMGGSTQSRLSADDDQPQQQQVGIHNPSSDIQ